MVLADHKPNLVIARFKLSISNSLLTDRRFILAKANSVLANRRFILARALKGGVVSFLKPLNLLRNLIPCALSKNNVIKKYIP